MSTGRGSSSGSGSSSRNINNNNNNPSSSSNSNRQNQPNFPHDSNWDSLLSHSSALGILKPNIVFDVFNMAQHLPHPRLVRTAHNDAGLSVFAGDDLVTPFFPFGPMASAFTVFDTRQSVPASNTDTAPELSNALPRCPPAGVVFCLSDFPPNYSAPMHRTLSLDYAVVLSGEIVLTLDSGEEKTVRAGDFIVQQGVNHEWHNRSADPCRLLCVMVGAEKVTLKDGTQLEETVFKR